jgi:hypothetical protein
MFRAFQPIRVIVELSDPFVGCECGIITLTPKYTRNHQQDDCVHMCLYCCNCVMKFLTTCNILAMLVLPTFIESHSIGLIRQSWGWLSHSLSCSIIGSFVAMFIAIKRWIVHCDLRCNRTCDRRSWSLSQSIVRSSVMMEHVIIDRDCRRDWSCNRLSRSPLQLKWSSRT